MEYDFIRIRIGRETRHLIGKQRLPPEKQRLCVRFCRKTDIRKKFGQPLACQRQILFPVHVTADADCVHHFPILN
jgi:hypothetical protein